MAFRRKFSRRPKRFLRRRPLARVRRTWITSLVPTPCLFPELEVAECKDPPQPSAQARIVLVDNSVLEDKFSDRARVKRIVGDLWLYPTWDATTPTNDCISNFLAVLSAFWQTHVGLRRYETNAAHEALALHPLTEDYDYSEGQWLRTWQHVWVPSGEVQFTPPHQTVSCFAATCPDVHTAGLLDNDFVDGTGTINIETDCTTGEVQTCTANQDALCVQAFKYPIPWHLHFDMKRSIPLREDQNLALEFEFIAANAATLVNPRVQFLGGIKCLLEY